MEEIIPGFFSGIVATVLCNPLDVIRINYQLKNKIYVSPKIFYKGLSYGVLAIPSFWVIYFPTYKQLKDKDYLPNFLSAYISCCVSSSITSPIWYLRQITQTDKLHNWNEPILNYYRGLTHTYLTNLNFIVQIPTYEYLKTKVENNTFNIFLITSFSKTLSTSIFYPFDTIRAKIRNGDPINNINFKGYYKGISIYLLRSIPYHTSIFCTYEFIKKRI